MVGFAGLHAALSVIKIVVPVVFVGDDVAAEVAALGDLEGGEKESLLEQSLLQEDVGIPEQASTLATGATPA